MFSKMGKGKFQRRDFPFSKRKGGQYHNTVMQIICGEASPEYCIQFEFWLFSFKNDEMELEKVNKKKTKMIEGLGQKAAQKIMKIHLKLFSLK